jgi:hypothetical protein
MPTAGDNCHALPGVAPGWAVRQALAGSIAFALAVGLFLVARRFTGALIDPLPPLQLVIAASLLVALALAVRALITDRYASWISSGALFLFALGCSFPGERAIDWLVWLPAFGALIASHGAIQRTPVRRRPLPANCEKVLQQITRVRTASGNEVIHATLLAEFARGQRTATIYVGFCPPFERLPHVELESVADAKMVQVLHQGAQLEVRLPRDADSPAMASVELFASDAE